MKRYNNYHKHDYYGNIKSLDVVVSPLEYIQRAKELDGDKAIFFSTNHGYQGNIYEYYTLCKENNVKLIAGVEAYYVPDRFEKDRRNYHLIIIAKNKNGYKQINSIMSEANTTGFYYKPRVDDELIFKLNPNDVVITTACIASRLRDIEGAEDWIIKMKEYFKDNFYLEVQNHNVESQKEYNKRLLEYSEKYNIPIIHANDSHYIYEKDSKYRDLFLKAKGITYGEEDSFILDYPNYETILKRYENQGILTREQAKIALDNTLIFDSLEGIEFDYEIKMPYISDNPSKELGGIIKKEFEKEIKEKHINIKRKEEYIQAIKEEWKVIEETKMHEYFLINYKMVHLAVNKYNGIITKSSRGCFTEDALVHTKYSLKSIKDVKVGDYVVTKNGDFNKVLNTMKYSIDEELIQIKHLYGTDKYNPTICTLDHKILINRNSQLKWIQAKDIEKSDYVCVPKVKIKDNKINKIDLNDYNIYGYEYDEDYIYERRENIGKSYKYSPSDVARHIGVGKSVIENFANMKKVFYNKKTEKMKELMDYIPFNSQQEYHDFIESKKIIKINRYINIDSTFNEFVGLMYGDGFTHKHKNGNIDFVGLAINNTTSKDEYNRKVFNEIAKRLNIDVYENRSKTKKLSQLYLRSKIFGNFVRTMLFESKKGKDKIFNDFWLYQSKENLLGIIKGLRQSDGYKRDNEISFDNTSKSLINAYKLICLMTEEGVNSLDIRPSWTSKDGYICKESYKMRLNISKNKINYKIKEDKNYYYLPIKEITKLPKQKTYVYDIEVENEHNYLLNNMIVHNSAPSFYINKLLGFTSLDRLNSPITLYPSRFMSATRILQSKSLPDIDTNVAFQQPFIDASKELLGEDNCQWMVSFKPLQDASAFRLYCKAIDMEVEEYDEIAKNLDEYREDKEWKDIIEESKHFVGVVEAISQSPCSTLLLSEPISQQIGLLKVGDIICCNIDGINCDRYKFLKNDILAVSVYKIIYKVCELIGIDIPSTQELTNLLDEKTWKIYEDGLTCTINQADSNFATPLVMKYKPKSVAEMSAFVAAIRPGFTSLLEGFINRKPYTTGVKELDDLLEDSYHYLMYQESIMKYLIWLGIPESETYTIIKKISKKKFKEKELKELKTKLRQGWNKVVGKEEGFEETWQVINDSASYSFNASHSLSYAYDSLYGAYLKSHYPLEYYTVALNQYKDDLSRTPRLINECKYFNIKIQTPKFGYSKAEYSFDKETRTIYKGVGSLKYLNEQKADFLYELSQSKEYKTFTELLCDIKPIGNRCILILIKLGYFSKFGSISKLLKVFELYKDKGNKKTMSKTKDIELYMTYKELAEKNATKETAKTLTINYISFIKDIELTLEDTEDDIVQLIKDEIEYTGGFNAVPYKQMDKNACFISDLKVYNYNIIVTLFCFYSGNVKTFKMDKKIYNQCPFTKEEVLYLYGFVPRKNKKSKTVDYYITDFEVA